MNTNDPLVTPEWLDQHRDAVIVLDATYFLPPDAARARREFAEGHIPGARFFDIDAVADQDTALPHMLPTAESFAAAVGGLGVGNDDFVVVYDRSSNHFSAPRVWWTFRVFGHRRVAVLDGGFTAWRNAGGAVETGMPPPPAAARRTTALEAGMVADLADMRKFVERKGLFQVLDARSRGRFEGVLPEPRPGVRGGRLAGARNLPFERMTAADGRFLDEAAIRAELDAAGVEPGRPVVASCGSGLTACVLALALSRAGRDDVAVYDGSWAEWGGRADTPVVTGATKA